MLTKAAHSRDSLRSSLFVDVRFSDHGRMSIQELPIELIARVLYYVCDGCSKKKSRKDFLAVRHTNQKFKAISADHARVQLLRFAKSDSRKIKEWEFRAVISLDASDTIAVKRKVFEIRLGKTGIGDDDTRHRAWEILDLLVKEGRTAEATALAREVYQNFLAKIESPDLRTLEWASRVIKLLLDGGKHVEATEFTRDVYQQLLRRDEVHSDHTLKWASRVTERLVGEGKGADAAVFAKEVLEEILVHIGVEDERTIEWTLGVAKCFMDEDKIAEAVRVTGQVLQKINQLRPRCLYSTYWRVVREDEFMEKSWKNLIMKLGLHGQPKEKLMRHVHQRIVAQLDGKITLLDGCVRKCC